jgi:DNA modification methylase
MEIDAIYIDVAIRRWQRLTGDRAIHSVTKKYFDDLAAAQEVQNG